MKYVLFHSHVHMTCDDTLIRQSQLAVSQHTLQLILLLHTRCLDKKMFPHGGGGGGGGG